MEKTEIQQWAEGIWGSDSRVAEQRREKITGQDIARIVRAEQAATDDELEAIAEIVNEMRVWTQ